MLTLGDLITAQEQQQKTLYHSLPELEVKTTRAGLSKKLTTQARQSVQRKAGLG